MAAVEPVHYASIAPKGHIFTWKCNLPAQIWLILHVSIVYYLYWSHFTCVDPSLSVKTNGLHGRLADFFFYLIKNWEGVPRRGRSNNEPKPLHPTIHVEDTAYRWNEPNVPWKKLPDGNIQVFPILSGAKVEKTSVVVLSLPLHQILLVVQSWSYSPNFFHFLYCFMFCFFVHECGRRRNRVMSCFKIAGYGN